MCIKKIVYILSLFCVISDGDFRWRSWVHGSPLTWHNCACGDTAMSIESSSWCGSVIYLGSMGSYGCVILTAERLMLIWMCVCVCVCSTNTVVQYTHILILSLQPVEFTQPDHLPTVITVGLLMLETTNLNLSSFFFLSSFFLFSSSFFLSFFHVFTLPVYFLFSLFAVLVFLSMLFMSSFFFFLFHCSLISSICSIFCLIPFFL